MKKLLITLPCFNEELVLEKNAKVIFEYAKNNFTDYQWKILILDNASTDSTLEIAKKLLSEHPGEFLVDQEMEKGRGVALRKSWSRFVDFDIYCYMDIDLSTDIKDFKLLVDKVNENYDIVVGSRYLINSNIKRDFKRLILSKIYNLLLELVFRVKFEDAQCGFKAMSKKTVSNVVPYTTDAGWFWDTELMILLVRDGYSLLEIPVNWKEARDNQRKSTVLVWHEVVKQLQNIYRMKKRLIAMKTKNNS